ncbi:hypothetical protein M405DRAFT_835156 [Rhizopogon salebrosus TDB-379]|nr:hypothetical protein M405DRAFT_835156 [Rhizopogon salebrosus TDB-379]
MASTANDDDDATRRTRVYLLAKLWKPGERRQVLVTVEPSEKSLRKSSWRTTYIGIIRNQGRFFDAIDPGFIFKYSQRGRSLWGRRKRNTRLPPSLDIKSLYSRLYCFPLFRASLGILHMVPGSNGDGNLCLSNVDRGSVLTPRLMSTRQRHINARHSYIDTSMSHSSQLLRKTGTIYRQNVANNTK